MCARAALRRGLCALALALASLGGVCVDKETQQVTGRDVYLRYCASCHGSDARGGGPVAATLRQAPSDLTTLARRSGGRFDESYVMSTIDGRRAVAEHGVREMPVWGAVFEKEHEGEPFQAYVGLLQTRALVDYLRSIQEAE
jgi:mono/diheme cytochrome c family protein